MMSTGRLGRRWWNMWQMPTATAPTPTGFLGRKLVEKPWGFTRGKPGKWHVWCEINLVLRKHRFFWQRRLEVAENIPFGISKLSVVFWDCPWQKPFLRYLIFGNYIQWVIIIFLVEHRPCSGVNPIFRQIKTSRSSDCHFNGGPFLHRLTQWWREGTIKGAMGIYKFPICAPKSVGNSQGSCDSSLPNHLIDTYHLLL